MTLRQTPALDILISREVPAPGAVTETQLNPLGQPLPPPPAQTVTQTVPARRYDPPVRDEVETGSGSYFGINDSRYLVRQDTANPWTVNDYFTDETGQRRRIVGNRNFQQQAHISGGLIEIIGTTS